MLFRSYLYEPATHRLVGERRGRVFQLADAVEVELVGADLRHRGLDLKIAGMPEPPPRGGAGPRQRGRTPVRAPRRAANPPRVP